MQRYTEILKIHKQNQMVTNIETLSTKHLVVTKVSMMQTLKNPVCNPIYQPVQATINQITNELKRRAYASSTR